MIRLESWLDTCFFFQEKTAKTRRRLSFAPPPIPTCTAVPRTETPRSAIPSPDSDETDVMDSLADCSTLGSKTPTTPLCLVVSTQRGRQTTSLV